MFDNKNYGSENNFKLYNEEDFEKIGESKSIMPIDIPSGMLLDQDNNGKKTDKGDFDEEDNIFFYDGYHDEFLNEN